MSRRLFQTLTFLFAAALTAGLIAAPANASVIFSDSFNRADSNTVGTNDNALGGTITQTWLEREEDSQVTEEAIESNQLRLQDSGTGGGTQGQTSFVAADHNFNTSDITTSGGFVLSFKVDPVVDGDALTNNWAAFSLGHTKTTATDGDDDLVHTSNTTPIGFNIGDDGTYAFFDSGTNVSNDDGDRQSVGGTITGSRVYDIEATIATTSFASGANATISIKVDGTQIDLDGSTAGTQDYTFAWDHTDNYLNLEAHPTNNADFDDVAIALIPEPASLALLGLGSLAMLARRRKDQASA